MNKLNMMQPGQKVLSFAEERLHENVQTRQLALNQGLDYVIKYSAGQN